MKLLKCLSADARPGKLELVHVACSSGRAQTRQQLGLGDESDDSACRAFNDAQAHLRSRLLRRNKNGSRGCLGNGSFTG